MLSMQSLNCNIPVNNSVFEPQLPRRLVKSHSNSTIGNLDTREGLSWRRMQLSRAKLKATTFTSELFAGFTMTSVVELQINYPTEVPEWLFVLFATSAAVIVSINIFALMISTYLLPNIEAINGLEKVSLVHESPHERMKNFIEVSWTLTNILSLLLFLVHMILLAWVKFWDYSFKAPIAASIVVAPVICLFVLFAGYFYHSLVVVKSNASAECMIELDLMKRNLDVV